MYVAEQVDFNVASTEDSDAFGRPRGLFAAALQFAADESLIAVETNLDILTTKQPRNILLIAQNKEIVRVLGNPDAQFVPLYVLVHDHHAAGGNDPGAGFLSRFPWRSVVEDRRRCTASQSQYHQ